ncbi:MAG: hypothetical protein IPP77_13440 [Bacteroidetes bacterium]|nr:hypothetical protein [Bacteroidota bacterium]
MNRDFGCTIFKMIDVNITNRVAYGYSGANDKLFSNNEKPTKAGLVENFNGTTDF